MSLERSKEAPVPCSPLSWDCCVYSQLHHHLQETSDSVLKKSPDYTSMKPWLRWEAGHSCRWCRRGSWTQEMQKKVQRDLPKGAQVLCLLSLWCGCHTAQSGEQGRCWHCRSSITQGSTQPSPPAHTCPGKQTKQLLCLLLRALHSYSFGGCSAASTTLIFLFGAYPLLVDQNLFCLSLQNSVMVGVIWDNEHKSYQCGWGELLLPQLHSCTWLFQVSDTIMSVESIKQGSDGHDLDQGDFPVPKWLYSQVTVAFLFLDTLPKPKDCCLMGKNNRMVINNWDEEGFPLTDHIWQVIRLKIHHCHFSSINSERMVLH